jgi:arylsulfatase A-like enzyme
MGGSANWGNIRGLLANNVPDLQLYEEGDHRAPRVNVWGISDLQLFEEALSVLQERRPGPFFAVIKTSGSHRPYTIPPDTSFALDPRTDDETRAHGFASNAEYNAFRYLDHSLGHFMALARREPWYANTIFVFFGDHGLGARAVPHVSPAERQLELTKLHVPLVIHAPALMGPPQDLPAVASELDLLPTVASAAGRRYVNTTLGRDLFDPDRAPYAFTIRHGGEPTIGVLSHDFWFQMRADGSGAILNALESGDAEADVSPAFPEQARQLRDLTRALHESARWLTFHNAPEPGLHVTASNTR